MTNNYILTSKNTQGLQNPCYFDDFPSMTKFVISSIRKDLIENEATYKEVIDFDETLDVEHEWCRDDGLDDTFIKIDTERQQIKAQTSEFNFYGVQYFGEKIPIKN